MKHALPEAAVLRPGGLIPRIPAPRLANLKVADSSAAQTVPKFGTSWLGREAVAVPETVSATAHSSECDKPE